MVFLPDYDITIKKKLGTFARKYFRAVVKPNVPVLVGYQFAPTYHIKKRNGNERVIIYRKPAIFPELDIAEIRAASKKGIGIYIAICDGERSELVDELSERCEDEGAGIIQNIGGSKFSVQPCVQDYPRDRIFENRVKFFVSSRLRIAERLMIREKLMSVKYQPILVECISNHNPIEEECIKWVEQSEFFIGLVTPPFRPLVDKEIRHALKCKKHKFKIYIRMDALNTKPAGNSKSAAKAKKLLQLIEIIKKNGTHTKYASEPDLRKLIGNDISTLIKDNIIPDIPGKSKK